MSRKKIVVRDSSCHASGVEIYLDEYDTRGEAEEALYDAVLEYLDYGIDEIVEESEG